MTREEEEARALLENATKGPWSAMRRGNAPLDGRLVGQSQIMVGGRPLRQPFQEAYVGPRDYRDVYLRDDDADLVAAAPRLLTALLAEVDRLRALPVVTTCGACGWWETDATCNHPSAPEQDEPCVYPNTTPPAWCPLRGAP